MLSYGPFLSYSVCLIRAPNHMNKVLFSLGSLLASLLPTAASAAIGLERARDVARSEGLFLGTTLDIIQNIIIFLMTGNALLALGAMIWAATLYVTSLGNEDKLETAKKTVLYAMVGLLLMAGVFIILQIIKKIIVP